MAQQRAGGCLRKAGASRDICHDSWWHSAELVSKYRISLICLGLLIYNGILRFIYGAININKTPTPVFVQRHWGGARGAWGGGSGTGGECLQGS